MSFKYFIWLVHVPMYLWEFSWNFQNLLSIFHAFKTISRFSRIVFAFKIISEKKSYPFSLGRARRPDRTRSGPAARPAKAHRPSRAMAMAAAAFLACVPRQVASPAHL
jgi:hypothetical protein